MNRPIFFATLLASMVALAVSTPAPAEVDPALLAEQDMAAESRGDVTAALALYSDDAIVQYGGLCWTPCVGKAAIQKELERRVEAKNRWKIIGKYVSGNVAVVQTELQIGYIEPSGVERVVVWCTYETKGDKIAVVTLAGQRTDPQTARSVQGHGAFVGGVVKAVDAANKTITVGDRRLTEFRSVRPASSAMPRYPQ